MYFVIYYVERDLLQKQPLEELHADSSRSSNQLQLQQQPQHQGQQLEQLEQQLGQKQPQHLD